MTIGIKGIGVYLPLDHISNYDQIDAFDISEEFINEKIGMQQLAKMPEGVDTSDLAKEAVLDLFNAYSVSADQIECLVLVTQNPDGNGLPHTSAILHNKLSLQESCVVFDVSLGCSGYVHGLSIIKSFMEAHGMTNGLLVTSDPYSKILDPLDRDTAMLFGDGATATWLGTAPQWEIGPFDFGTLSDQYEALTIKPDGKLKMNGRAIFNFAATQVPKSVNRLLDKTGLSFSDIDLFAMHQGSRYIVDTLARRMKVEGKVPFMASRYGNTVPSSVPMLLKDCVTNDARRVIISGFGVGLAWATCILERRT